MRDLRRRGRARPQAACPAPRARRRPRLHARRDRRRTPGARGRSSGSSTRRTTGCATSCCATSSGATTRSASTSTSRSTGRIAPCEVCDALRAYLPELLALSASSPFLEHVNTGLHSVRTQIFTSFFPRCGIPDVYGDWRTFEDYCRFLFDTGLDHTSTRRCGGRCARTSRSRRSRSGSATRSRSQEEAISLAALAYSLTARIARALDEGEELLHPPHREIEENFWRAIRWGLSRRADRPRDARGAADARRDRGADRVGAAGRRGARRGGVPVGARGERVPSARSRASRRARRSRRSTRSRFAPRRLVGG